MVIGFLLLQGQGWLEWFNLYVAQGTSDWIPRAHCVAENPIVMGLHIISELLIGIAYFSIPMILWYIVKRKAEFFRQYKPIILLFAAFIFLCGTTHFIGIVMFWYPIYWVDGIIKLLTGLVSVLTAYTLIRLIPSILRLPTESEMFDAYTKVEKLEKYNKYLENRLEGFTESVSSQVQQFKAERDAVLQELKNDAKR